MTQENINEKVFISYSWDSLEHCDKVLNLANKLRQEGVDTEIDQYEECPAEGWPLWMQTQITNATYVLVVCTETYLKRVEKRESKGNGLGVTWEASLMYQLLYEQQGSNTKFIPIIFNENDIKNIPLPLKSTTIYNLENNKDYNKLYGRLTNNPIIKKPELGKRIPLKAKEVKTDPKSMFLTSVIDIDLWNKASWSGTGFLCGGNIPPILLIAYKNINSGIEIFKDWKKYFKEYDKNEEIRISIIEGDIPNELPGYSVHINSNFDFKFHQFENAGIIKSPEEILLMTVGRFNRMNPQRGKSPYLEVFKKEYEYFGFYFIAPAKYDETTGNIVPYLDYKILKKTILFRDVSEITKNDIDYIVLKDSELKL